MNSHAHIPPKGPILNGLTHLFGPITFEITSYTVSISASEEEFSSVQLQIFCDRLRVLCRKEKGVISVTLRRAEPDPRQIEPVIYTADEGTFDVSRQNGMVILRAIAATHAYIHIDNIRQLLDHDPDCTEHDEESRVISVVLGELP